MLVSEVEVILVYPTLLVFQMWALVVFASDGHQNTGRFPSFQDDGNAVCWGVFQVRQDEIIPALFLRGIYDGGAPFLRTIAEPIHKRVGDIRQRAVRYPSAVAVGIEESQHPFGLLKRLNHSIQQQPIEAPVPELDAILVMLVKGVHRDLQCGQIPGRLLPWTPSVPCPELLAGAVSAI